MKRNLQEQDQMVTSEFISRFSKYKKEDVLKLYVDYVLIPQASSWTDPLLKQNYGRYVFDALKDTFPLDETIEKLSKRYLMDVNQFFKLEAHHKVYIYVLVAKKSGNTSLIINEMEHLGYFVESMSDVDLFGMPFQSILFEPKEQVDITDEIKAKTDKLYHLTPNYSYPNIVKQGLKPPHDNTIFDAPPRIYFLDSNIPEEDILAVGNALCLAVSDPKNTGEYMLLEVNIKDSPEDVRFYYDPNSEHGIFTKSMIDKDRLSVKMIVNFK